LLRTRIDDASGWHVDTWLGPAGPRDRGSAIDELNTRHQRLEADQVFSGSVYALADSYDMGG